jgi:GT2 family glycosyltransferase
LGTPVSLRKSTSPQLSVLIFTRNDAAHLEACLQTLVDDPPALDFEVRVFENASDDSSLAVLSSFESELPLTWLAERQETSFSIGNNLLLHQAEGDLVLFLNPDTVPTGSVIDACAVLALSAPDVGLVSPCLIYPDGERQATGWHLPSPARLVLEHAGLAERELGADPSGVTDVGWLMGCFLMGDREFLLSCGGFDEDFWFHGTDLELCARVRAVGRRVVRVETVAIVHVGHRSWDARRRESSQKALTQWLRRDHGPLSAAGVRVAARCSEALR